MNLLRHIDISGPGGPLSVIVHLPHPEPAPVVVCCHGLLSSKESQKYVSIGNEFSRNGLGVVRFDFSDCGKSKASLGESLIGSRLRDFDAVLNYIHLQPWCDGRVGLLGSSLGGYVALLGGTSHDVKAVVCWATPFDLDRIHLAAEDSQAVEEHFPPGFQVGHPRNLSSLPPISSVLIIHGQQDEIVSWREAEEIYHQVGEPRRLLLMQNADHRFLDPSCRRLAMEQSLKWFHEQGLNQGH